MPHIHTKPGEHDLTASAYIVRHIPGRKPELLLHEHKLLRRFLQLGGHVELQETPWETVLRELAEEGGYAHEQLTVLQPHVRIEHLSDVTLHPIPLVVLTHSFDKLDHNHSDIAWAFFTNEPPRNQVGAGESAEIKFFDEEALRDLPGSSIPQDVREIGLFVLCVAVPQWERVAI